MTPTRRSQDDPALRALLRFSDRCRARDLEGTLGLFAKDADVLLIGSEAGEAVRGRRALQDFFIRLFDRDVAYSWEFDRSSSGAAGDVAWVFAEGWELMTSPAGDEKRVPFRMSGVLERTGEGWLWRMLQGSEPAEHY